MDIKEYRKQIEQKIEDAKRQIEQWNSGKIFGVEQLDGRWKDLKPQAVTSLEQIVKDWEKILKMLDDPRVIGNG